MTKWGTSYFVSRRHAQRYYRPYMYEDVKATVERKIEEGEIHIGRPPLKVGEKLSIIDDGCRYAITEGK